MEKPILHLSVNASVLLSSGCTHLFDPCLPWESPGLLQGHERGDAFQWYGTIAGPWVSVEKGTCVTSGTGS